MSSYNVGDTIIYQDAGATATYEVVVTQRWTDIISTYLIPSFEGRDRSGRLRWGHDRQILIIRPS